ncbi:MAG: ketoacyl-ACP synthase III [Nitrospinae bacterium]|nr:ketoacyl-ACP synthase III [Nitrospinota bacterium]
MKKEGKRSRIAGIGMNMPSKILSNADLEKLVDTSDEWIVTRTGIKERRIAEEGMTASKLAVPAVLEAIRNGGIAAEDIDLIICATSTPDMTYPSTACFIQSEIGAGDCPAFDISAACSGFVYGLTIADKFIKTGSARNAIVIGSELNSRLVDWDDRSTCVLFGDGAAAVVLSASDGQSGIMESMIFADGSYSDMLTAGHGSANPAKSGADPKSHCIKMKGNQLFKVAVKSMADVAGELLKRNGLTADDVKLVIPHQANVRIINAVAKAMGVSDGKIYVNVHRYGNTSAATIPIAMYEAWAEGRLKKGDIALLVAFGGGLTWGATLLRW